MHSTEQTSGKALRDEETTRYNSLAQLMQSVLDPGEGLGPPYFQTKLRSERPKKRFETGLPPPHLSQGLDDQAPPI